MLLRKSNWLRPYVINTALRCQARVVRGAGCTFLLYRNSREAICNQFCARSLLALTSSSAVIDLRMVEILPILQQIGSAKAGWLLELFAIYMVDV